MKKRLNYNIVVLMTDENIYGRELLVDFLKSDFEVKAIIVERGSELAEQTKGYLKNDFYSPPSLSEIAKGKNLAVVYTENHNSDDCHQKLLSLSPDIILAGGCRILKDYIIKTAKIGVLNCHPGLLPEYRGLDPVAWSIYNGESIGATCHFVDSGVDMGAILIRQKEKWEIGESLLQIRVRMMSVCAKLTLKAVRGLKDGSLKPRPQVGQGKRYYEMPAEIKEKVGQILAGKFGKK